MISIIERFRSRLQHIILTSRTSWHRYAFPEMVSNNNSADSENWFLIANSSTNVQLNAALSSLATGLIGDGWHGKAIYSDHPFFEPLLGPDESGISGALRVFRRESGIIAGNHPDNDVGLGNWQIDINARKIILRDINFYDLLSSSLSNFSKKYDVNFQAQEIITLLEDLKSSIEAVLRLCIKIEDAARSGKRITIALIESHIVPNAVFVSYFCQPSIAGLVQLKLIGPAYTGYTIGRMSTPHIMMRPADLVYPLAYYAEKEEFDEWYKTIKASTRDTIIKTGQSIVDSKRVRRLIGNFDEPEIITRINATKAAGLPIYCLFAHLFYDRPIVDHTTEFDGMIDWIRKTIDAFEKIDGLLLLKPHVAEAFLKGAKAANETLHGLSTSIRLPENVVVLPPNQLLANEIAELIDAAIIWRSTAYLEMTILGVPAIFCGPNAPYSEPMAVRRLEDFGSYANALQALPTIKVETPERHRALAIIYFLNVIKVIKIRELLVLPKWLCGDNVVLSPVSVVMKKIGIWRVGNSLARLITSTDNEFKIHTTSNYRKRFRRLS